MVGERGGGRGRGSEGEMKYGREWDGRQEEEGGDGRPQVEGGTEGYKVTRNFFLGKLILPHQPHTKVILSHKTFTSAFPVLSRIILNLRCSFYNLLR